MAIFCKLYINPDHDLYPLLSADISVTTGTIHDLDAPDAGVIKPNFEDIRDVKDSYQHYFER